MKTPPVSFISPEPDVRLVKAFTTPFKNALAAARTCYSSSGIVSDEQIDLERSRGLAESIYLAGHHTTLQHAYVQFAIGNVSRHFVWSFLHSHPFYNSEQVSQRYVEVRPGSVVVPPLDGEARAVYEGAAEMQSRAYERLTPLLEPEVAAEYFKRFPARAKQRHLYAREIRRKAQEAARYILPIGTFTYLYHTVSVLTILRYARLASQLDLPAEQTIVVSKMVNALLAHDPNYALILEEPLPEDAYPEYRFAARQDGLSAGFVEEFDRALDGKTSRLAASPPDGERNLAEAVRTVLGMPRDLLSDQEAIALALDPSRNRIFGESLVLSSHTKLSRALYHVSYTFRKKLSHSADSQDQRHRMTPASRPVFHLHLGQEPDFITPRLVERVPEAARLYRDTMERTWESASTLRRLDVPEEFVTYIYPNAVPVRFFESADLLNLHHKLAMRLCYNAQEEIWRASLDEALQVSGVHPRIGRYLLPPCTLRSRGGMKPICPEGSRYCGVKVWRIEKSEYERVI